MSQTFDSIVLYQMTYAALHSVSIYKKYQLTLYINLHITTTNNILENIYFNYCSS